MKNFYNLEARCLGWDFNSCAMYSALRNFAHAIYIDFFQAKILSEKNLMFLIFLLKTLIVGTC